MDFFDIGSQYDRALRSEVTLITFLMGIDQGL